MESALKRRFFYFDKYSYPAIIKHMKIAIIVPPFTTVPPQKQGGTERIAHQMIEGFALRGHKVTLFGTGKYKGSAKFVQIFKKTISERKTDTTYIEASRNLRLESAYNATIMREIIKRDGQFDIIFNHARAGFLFLPLTKYIKTPIVSIMHLPIFKEVADVLTSYKKPNIITISNDQRKDFPKIKYLTTVYNGTDINEFDFCDKPKDYFLFMGAMSEHKNPKDAIIACQRAKVNLVLAGGKKREPYFSKEIMPLVDGKQIKYAGEVMGQERINLYKYAKGFIFPIKWQEPFGLVVIEAMACGTPAIVYPNGGPKEIVNKKTGFVVNNISGIVESIKKIDTIKRIDCRKRVEKYFSNKKMVNDYEQICYNLTKK